MSEQTGRINNSRLLYSLLDVLIWFSSLSVHLNEQYDLSHL